MGKFSNPNPKTRSGARRVTGKAADAGYTAEKASQQQAANRQIVQNLWNTGQAKAAQDNSTNRAYTAKLTGGANIDNSKALVSNLQNTFSGYNDSAKTQYERALTSKQGRGRNWSSPKSAAGNVLMSAVADTTAGWLNTAGTTLKSNRKSGLAVDSGDVSAETTGSEWYNRAGNYLQREADRAQQIGEIAYHRGGYGLNNAQKLLYDAGIAGTQMMGDFALGMGSGATIPMAIRSFGSGAMEARRAGASENQQILYGAANAAVEAATEKMFDGVARIHGKGMADDMVDDFAKRWATSEGGQALIRGAAGMGGEGLEEMVSSLANPALKTLYNGRSLRENYSALNPNDVLYEGAIGALLGNIGGVNVMRTVGSAPGSNLSRARPDFLYHAAMDDRARGFGSAAIDDSYLLPYSDTYNTPTSAMGSGSADAMQDWIIEQCIAEIEKAKAADASERARYKELERKFLDGTITKEEGEELWRLEGTGKFGTSSETEKNTPVSEYAYYKELEHKYLRGNISEEEFEELRKLENIWGQFDAEVKEYGTSAKERYRKLEQKFRNGNINEQEWNEMIRLENTLKQSDAPSKYASEAWETDEVETHVEWDKWKNDIATAEFFGLSSSGNLSSIVKRSTIKTQGGFECFPDGDPLKRNVQNVTPLKGYFDVAMHGEPDMVCFGGRKRNMTARMLASVIRHSEGYNGQNIRLLSCSTGKREGDSLCFAEELANALGVTVQAPNLKLYISESGMFQVGQYGEGAFVEYKPNERRRLK